ncbi:hypothetical protein B0H10DRAFT_1955486 [Mycena sp. CBHHK59/15]|nr:hypothetical protein B0H10DRAFT_1955486 [Mycena sp. CBHHK59/15]
MASTPLKEYFWRGEKQNSSMYHTYCKACVAHHLDGARTTTANLAQSLEEFKEQSRQKQWMVETRVIMTSLLVCLTVSRCGSRQEASCTEASSTGDGAGGAVDAGIGRGGGEWGPGMMVP